MRNIERNKNSKSLCNISKLKPKLSTYGAVFLNRLLMLVVLDSFISQFVWLQYSLEAGLKALKSKTQSENTCTFDIIT